MDLNFIDLIVHLHPSFPSNLNLAGLGRIDVGPESATRPLAALYVLVSRLMATWGMLGSVLRCGRVGLRKGCALV